MINAVHVALKGKALSQSNLSVRAMPKHKAPLRSFLYFCFGAQAINSVKTRSAAGGFLIAYTGKRPAKLIAN